MTEREWHASVSSFARSRGYRFVGDLAFCRVEAPFGQTRVELWISAMGPGEHRNTLAGAMGGDGTLHCRVKAKVVGEVGVEVRRKTLLDRILSRGVRLGLAEFDASYVALGKEVDVRRFMSTPVVDAFVRMWSRTPALCLEDGEVSLSSARFTLAPDDLALLVDTVGTIAAGGARPST